MKVIGRFLTHGSVTSPTKRDLSPSGVKDVDRGLGLDLPVVLYTNDHETKAVLEREARTLDPSFTRRSGSRYRLNRWREAQLARSARITYRDLVKEDVRLNRRETTYRRVPVRRYCDFLSDFMAGNPGHDGGPIRAWKTVKEGTRPTNDTALTRTRGTKPGASRQRS